MNRCDDSGSRVVLLLRTEAPAIAERVFCAACLLRAVLLAGPAGVGIQVEGVVGDGAVLLIHCDVLAQNGGGQGLNAFKKSRCRHHGEW